MLWCVFFFSFCLLGDFHVRICIVSTCEIVSEQHFLILKVPIRDAFDTPSIFPFLKMRKAVDCT